MQPHRGDEEEVRHAAVQLHPGGVEMAVPVLQDDAGFVEARIEQGRRHRPHAGGDHAHVGEDERQDARAMIERTGDHGRQVVLRGDAPQASADVRQFTRSKRLVAGSTRGQFHNAKHPQRTAKRPRETRPRQIVPPLGEPNIIQPEGRRLQASLQTCSNV